MPSSQQLQDAVAADEPRPARYQNSRHGNLPSDCAKTIAERRSATSLSQQVDVSAIDELRRLHLQARHETFRLAHTRIQRFVVAKHDLQLHELAEAFYVVEVNACAADHEQRATLAHATDLAVSEGERFTQ